MSENENIIVLTDDEGNNLECEYLDTITYKNKEYAILYPLDQDEDEGEVLILEVVENDDDSEDYLPVEDEEILDAVFDEYMKVAELELEE